MDLDELRQSDKIVAGAGIVLAVDLAFLPWRSIDLGITTFTRSAVESSDAWLGILALALTAAVVAVTVLRARGRDHVLPGLPVPWELATSVAAGATLALILAKLVLHTDSLGVGAWLAVLLAAAMTGGAVLGLRDDVAE